MPQESKRRRRHRSRPTNQFADPAASGERPQQPWLVSATDACLCLTFLLVALGFGGRAAIGQLFLVAGALTTTGCWLLHQLTASERKYIWTGSEWLWCLGILVAGIQIAPLPHSWLLAISPHLKEVLPLLFSSTAGSPLSAGWNQLSLAPGETASGLATFAAYGLLFLVVVQRVQTLADVERVLCASALASIAMGAFALAQYFASNDKFYWMIDHPFMTTSHCTLGCFTNRNHLAQFLALGMGPLVWWILRSFHNQEQAGEKDLSVQLRRVLALFLLAGLGIAVLAALLCYSRGGVLSLGIAAGVSFGLLCRMGLASAKLALGLAVAGLAVGGIFFMTGFEILEQRLEGTLANNSKEGRFVIWQSNIDVAREFPWLGTGIGTHADAYHLHFDQAIEGGTEYTHAENGYLQVTSESGLCGLLVALAFIAVSLRICLRGLWHQDLRYRSAAAAVLASLLANVSHAGFDFFWYTPSCMLLLAIQLAAIVRLARSTGESTTSDKLPAPGIRLPRLITLVSAGGLAAAGCWMLGHKIPAAQAEPDRLSYLYLSHHSSENDDEDDELADEHGDLVIRAAKLDPSDSHLQESAGIEYLRRFDARQQTSDNPLALGQIRDVVKASEFQTTQALREWMQVAVGENTRLLQLAARSFKRAIQASPLRAHAYIKFAELSFLTRSGSDSEFAILKQALTLRPHDPQVLFQVGRNVMLTGDIDGALVYWRDAFARSRRIQAIIVRQLAPHIDPDFFLDNLKPDWEAQGLIARAYQEIGREDDARPIWKMHIHDGMKRLMATMPQVELEMTAISLHDACTALGEHELAIKVLSRGLQRVPQSFHIRHRLGWGLYSAGRFADAADHLKWCASRRPDDKPLQEAAAMATKQSLKAANRETPSTSG